MRTMVCAVALLIGAGMAGAATVQWTYERPLSVVLQIMSDGSGGCGILAVDTNGLFCVAWLGSKGEVLYEVVLPSSVMSFGVMSCDKAGLLYSVVSGGMYYLMYIDRKGGQSVILDPASNIIPTITPAYFTSRFSDAKGFFATHQATAPPNLAWVVRYSRK